MRWNEKWQCPYCLKNDCVVSITEHRDPYATGDSPTEYEVITTCCGVDAVEAGTYCQCGNEVYDDGMCLYCYAEYYEKEEKETEMKVLDMTVAELIKRGASVDVHLHNTDEETGTAFVNEMIGQDAEQYEFDSFTSYARREGMVSVTSYVWRDENE